MEWTRTVRPIVIGIVALSLNAAAYADPAKPAPPKSQEGPALKIVLASAATAQAPAGETGEAGAANADAPAKKKRVARQTSCRCGGQTASSND
jgi:hypothetical protein